MVTVPRGKVVVENGESRGDPADGRYLHRTIPRWVRARRSARDPAPTDTGGGERES